MTDAIETSRVSCVEIKLVSPSSRLEMKAGDLIEILDSDVASSPSTSSSRDESRDVELLRGRNDMSGKEGKFTAGCVYVLPTVDKPTHEFVVSLLQANYVCDVDDRQ